MSQEGIQEAKKETKQMSQEGSQVDLAKKAYKQMNQEGRWVKKAYKQMSQADKPRRHLSRWARKATKRPLCTQNSACCML